MIWLEVQSLREGSASQGPVPEAKPGPAQGEVRLGPFRGGLDGQFSLLCSLKRSVQLYQNLGYGGCRTELAVAQSPALGTKRRARIEPDLLRLHPAKPLLQICSELLR